MEQAERDALLRVCIDQLSSDHHQVMEMAFGIGASMQKIAKIQQYAIGTVKSRFFHARKYDGRYESAKSKFYLIGA